MAGAAKDAVKKSPLGFMQVGDLALSFPGQANDKDAFTAPKPGEAKGLPDSPIAKPPSGLGLNLNLPGSNVKKSDLPDGPKFGGGVSTPDVTPTADVPDVPSPEEVNKPEKVQNVQGSSCLNCLLAKCSMVTNANFARHFFVDFSKEDYKSLETPHVTPTACVLDVPSPEEVIDDAFLFLAELCFALLVVALFTW